MDILLLSRSSIKKLEILSKGLIRANTTFVSITSYLEFLPSLATLVRMSPQASPIKYLMFDTGCVIKASDRGNLAGEVG